MIASEAALNVLLVSTYELGRQPFGLASAAAWLGNAGMSVSCLDLSREALREDQVRQADLIAFYVPMHTATRLAVNVLPAVRRLNPQARLCFYGLYAPANESYLRRLGAEIILGGEFEEALLQSVQRPQVQPSVQRGPLPRLKFLTPDRTGLPPLKRYAHLEHPDGDPRICGYTEASRGCKHLCRHCPVVPVYQGQFRIVPLEVVLEDIRHQVELGAEHITFGDPDFFNGPRHALRIITALHHEHPALTYDVTIKVEHLLKHAGHLSTLLDTGCLFVTTAVESLDDAVLARLEKGHTRADFLRVVELFRAARLALSPTFVAFTPWTTLDAFCDLLEMLARLDLIPSVAPVQLGIRLLIPAGSRLLELEEIRSLVAPFSEAELIYPWQHQDPSVDELYERVQGIIRGGVSDKESREAIYSKVRAAACEMKGRAAVPFPDLPALASRSSVPYLTEPWYC